MKTPSKLWKAVAYLPFPHEQLIFDHKLDTGSFSASLSRQVDFFNQKYYDLYYDGVLDDKERAELTKLSGELAELIKEEYGMNEKVSGGDVVLTVLGSILLGVGAFFGIKKLSQ